MIIPTSVLIDSHPDFDPGTFQEAPGDEDEGGGSASPDANPPTEPAGGGDTADTGGAGTGDAKEGDTAKGGSGGEPDAGDTGQAGDETDPTAGEGGDDEGGEDEDTGGDDAGAGEDDEGAGDEGDEEEDPAVKARESILRQEIHDHYTTLKDQCDQMETIAERALNNDLVSQASVKGVTKIKEDGFTKSKDEITKILEYFESFDTDTLKKMLDLLKERVEFCTTFMNEFIDVSHRDDKS